MKQKIRSTLNASPHCLAGCFDCGWQGGDSQDSYEARLALFRHLRKEKCKKGYLEVGRVSYYEVINK